MKPPPFQSAQAEMSALQRRNEYYSARLNALNMTTNKTPVQKREIHYIERLNSGCQSAIAKYFSRGIHPAHEQNNH